MSSTETLSPATGNQPPSASIAASTRRRRSVASRLRHRFSIILAIAVVTLVLIVGGAVTPNKPAEPERPHVATVATRPAVPETGYELTREFVGRVEPRRRSHLSFELGGRVTEVLFDEGDAIHPGDVVARIDTEILTTRHASVTAQWKAAIAKLDELTAGPRAELIDAARAEVQRWRSEAALAAATQRRNAELSVSNAVSQQRLDESTYGLSAIEARLLAAQARLRELETGTRSEQIAAQRAEVARLRAEVETIDVQLDKSKLVAPYMGTVASRLIDEGTVIAAGSPVIELLETVQLDVRVGIDHESLDSLKTNQSQPVLIRGQHWTARVRSVVPQRDQQTRTVSVLLELPAGMDGVRVGDLATVRLTTRVDEPGYWLPVSALTEGYRGLWGCYVAIPQSPDSVDDLSAATHVLEPRELEVIHQTADRAYVRGSLEAGEAVVPLGLQRYVPGQAVRMVTRNASR